MFKLNVGIFEVKNIFKYHNNISWWYDYIGSLWEKEEKNIKESELSSGSQRQYALKCNLKLIQKIHFLINH